MSLLDHLPHLPGRWGTQGPPYIRYHHVSSHLRSPSTGVHLQEEVGHDRVDVLLHPRYSCLLVLRPSLLFLAHGRLLMGSDPCHHGRKWQETGGSRKRSPYSDVFAFSNLVFVNRTKESSTLALYLSNLGQNT